MWLKILLMVIGAWLIFELFEHAILPLVWLLMKKKRLKLTGSEGLIGEIGEIRQWRQSRGWIFVKGSLWEAECTVSLSPGDQAEVEGVSGLTLTVRPTDKS
jgi:membrane-bound ClpP family serine protease